MEEAVLIDLKAEELSKIEGGSELSEAINWCIGVMGSYMKSNHHVRSQYNLLVMGH